MRLSSTTIREVKLVVSEKLDQVDVNQLTDAEWLERFEGQTLEEIITTISRNPKLKLQFQMKQKKARKKLFNFMRKHERIIMNCDVLTSTSDPIDKIILSIQGGKQNGKAIYKLGCLLNASGIDYDVDINFKKEKTISRTYRGHLASCGFPIIPICR